MRGNNRNWSVIVLVSKIPVLKRGNTLAIPNSCGKMFVSIDRLNKDVKD